MIGIFSNPSYFLPPLIGAIVTLTLLVMALLLSRRDLSTWLFCAVLGSMILMNCIVFGLRSSSNAGDALIWQRAVSVPALAMFVFYYHFTLVYTNNRGQRYILWAYYFLLVLVACISPTDMMIKWMRVEANGYIPVVGVGSYTLLAMGPLLLFVAFYNLLKRYRASDSYEERWRLLCLVIAVIFPLTGAILDGFTNLPPSTIWGNLIFSIICTIAVVRYHLFDIRIFVHKGLVYILVSATIAVPYAGVLVIVNEFLKPAIEAWWLHALLILLLAIILRPLYGWAQNLVDKLFYRDRYNYLRELDRFIRETQSIADLKQLGARMINLIAGALRASRAYLLLPSDEKTGLEILYCIGVDSPPSGILLGMESPLTRWLKSRGQILSSEEITTIPELENLPRGEKDYLEHIGARLYVAIKIEQDKLSGILVLGQKLGGTPYTDEDKQLLVTISNHMAMILENARLYASEKAGRMGLEKLNEQKTEFLHTVAHDLKTPLTAIISSSEILSEDSSKSNEFRERLISNIRESAESMNRRVAELLNQAQIKIGEIGVELAPLETGRVISEVAAQLEILFGTKEQTLRLEIPDSLSSVNVDRAKLEQVLLNLLSNANKFSPKGSDIVLRAREVDKKIIVEVEDSAPLVPEREKERIFDPYYRSEDAGKRKRFLGLGLGLTISKKLVELHGGEIWVGSKSGKGNTFAFSLPVLDQGEKEIE